MTPQAPDGRTRRVVGEVAGGVGAEAVLWLIPAGLFLVLYLGAYGMPSSAVPAHVLVLAFLVAALAFIRFLVRSSVPARAGRLVDTALLAAGMALQWLYYALVLAGLASWSRVATLDLLAVYIRQFSRLMAILGINVALTMILLAGAVGLIGTALFFGLARWDWLGVLARDGGRNRRFAPVGAAFLAVLVIGLPVVDGGLARFGEPVSITVFGGDGDLANLLSHSVRRDPVAEAREQAVRDRYTPAPPGQRSNVILVIADSLREDHMGVYGYSRDTTPRLRQLQAVVATRRAEVARSVCSETVCGLLALASGRYVHEFVHRPVTLHEVLGRNGYRISLILSGDHTNFFGLRRMYGRVDDYVDGLQTRGYVNDDQGILDHVAGMPDWDGQPRLLQFHFMSTHCLGSRAKEHEIFGPMENYCASPAFRLRDPASRQRVVNHYDTGVRQFDAHLEGLLDVLQRKGYLRDALLAIVGDHGDYLGEHGRVSHGRGVHEPVLRIPFLLLSFGSAARGAFARQSATQADVAPTILADLGIPIPATWTGKPMQSAHPARLTFFQQSRDFGLIDESGAGPAWKYWRNVDSGREFAYLLDRTRVEDENMIERIAPARRAGWLFQTDALIARSGPTLLQQHFEREARP